MKKILVCGGGGFIGSHLVRKLVSQGHWVKSIDLKYPEFSKTVAQEFVVGDLRDQTFVAKELAIPYDEIYQLAADMGGAGYIFTKEHDATIMHNSCQINLNVLHRSVNVGVKKIFYSSSACIYPEENQTDPNNPNCEESSAYPANPDSEYGWEKIFSERLFQAFGKQHGIETRIARFHNIYGPEGTFQGGREKVPAAFSRKVSLAQDGTSIEIWGSGNQTRSFLYVDECIEGVLKLMESDYRKPINIGSDEMVSIDTLAKMIIKLSGKNLSLKHIDGPTGVMGRCSHNDLIEKTLGWRPSRPLLEGLTKTFHWIDSELKGKHDRKSENLKGSTL
jgi:GDP-D-mannose 3',5'-epimerase